MGPQQSQPTTGLTRKTTSRFYVGGALRHQHLPNVLVAETLQGEPAVQQCRIQPRFLGHHRSQTSVGPASANNRTAHGIEQPMNRRRQLHASQCLEVTVVGGARQVGPTWQVHHAFAQRHPRPAPLLSPGHQTPNAKPVRLIDGRLDPQDAAVLVVHLDRILVDPVFDPHAFGTSFVIRRRFAMERAVAAPAQKAQHVPADEVLQRMPDKLRVSFAQPRRVAEHDVAGVLRLPCRPVIRSEPVGGAVWRRHTPPAQPRHDGAGEAVQDSYPRARLQAIEQLLGAGEVVDAAETVVALLEADAFAGQLPGQVFAAVDTHLNGKRQPGLQTHVHQAKFAVQVVEIELQAFSGTQVQLQPVAVETHIESGTRFEATQDGDQALLHGALFEDVADDLVLVVPGRSHIAERPSQAFGHLLRMFSNPLRQPRRKRTEILEPDTLIDQELFQPSGKADGPLDAAEQQAVKAFQHAHDVRLVQLQEALHDVLLRDALANSSLQETSGASP